MLRGDNEERVVCGVEGKENEERVSVVLMLRGKIMKIGFYVVLRGER